MKNDRPCMEDKAFVATLSSDVCFCGVLDGHGGIKAVEYFIQIIPKEMKKALSQIVVPTKERIEEIVIEVFLKVDEQWFDQNTDFSGTTFTGVIIFSKIEEVYVINLGDSRTVICLEKEVRSSKDHKPSDPSEKERIIDAGGTVRYDRIDFEIGVSRALGDIDFKRRVNEGGDYKYMGRKAKVSPIPDVTRYLFRKNMKIVMGSDGLFDALRENEMILHHLEENNSCTSLMNYAKVTSSDNIMVMMLDLGK